MCSDQHRWWCRQRAQYQHIHDHHHTRWYVEREECADENISVTNIASVYAASKRHLRDTELRVQRLSSSMPRLGLHTHTTLVLTVHALGISPGRK